MAKKKSPPGKRRKKRKIRLSLKSSKIKKADSYTDQLGWSTAVGTKLTEPKKAKEPDTIRHQCTLCGAIMKVPKPKKSRYTITCPTCDHQDSFN
tara:strand:- start:227 stop:508 length:282 start_codon:yes stop_codon:yes gene_type:complete